MCVSCNCRFLLLLMECCCYVWCNNSRNNCSRSSSAVLLTRCLPPCLLCFAFCSYIFLKHLSVFFFFHIYSHHHLSAHVMIFYTPLSSVFFLFFFPEDDTLQKTCVTPPLPFLLFLLFTPPLYSFPRPRGSFSALRISLSCCRVLINLWTRFCHPFPVLLVHFFHLFFHDVLRQCQFFLYVLLYCFAVYYYVYYIASSSSFIVLLCSHFSASSYSSSLLSLEIPF